MNLIEKIKNWYNNIFNKKENDIIIIKEKNMKIAICVGINDYGPSQSLSGCLNDAQNWKNILEKTYGFVTTLLLDEQANKSGILNSFKKAVDNATKGDVVVLTYSGHGSKSGLNQYLCAFSGGVFDDPDRDWVRHDEIREIISSAKDGVFINIINDSCVNGSVSRILEIDKKARYLECPVTTRSFGNFHPYVSVESMKQDLDLSGSLDTTYSLDCNIGGNDCGAFSYYSIKILNENPKITYTELFKELKKYLPSAAYDQYPLLTGIQANKDKIVFTSL